MVDRRPLAVVHVADVDDIRTGLRLAREHQLPLAVRGGGHGIVGKGTVDDGLVLNLGGLRSIDVDAEGGIVRVAAGATLKAERCRRAETLTPELG